eukprot:1148247-Pelagomonas_calceolata.AAC.2
MQSYAFMAWNAGQHKVIGVMGLKGARSDGYGGAFTNSTVVHSQTPRWCNYKLYAGAFTKPQWCIRRLLTVVHSQTPYSGAFTNLFRRCIHKPLQVVHSQTLAGLCTCATTGCVKA